MIGVRPHHLGVEIGKEIVSGAMNGPSIFGDAMNLEIADARVTASSPPLAPECLGSLRRADGDAEARRW